MRLFQTRQNYFQIPAKKYSNKVILGLSLKIFIFAPNFVIRQIQGRRLKMTINCFPKHSKAFLVPNLRILTFSQNIGADFKYDNSFLKS